jgi:hypothetical protein
LASRNVLLAPAAFSTATAATLWPDFDTGWMHGREFPRQNKDIRLVPERAVYLGAQAS